MDDYEEPLEPYDGNIKDLHAYMVDLYFETNGGPIGFIIESYNDFLRRLPVIFSSTTFESKNGIFRLVAGCSFDEGEDALYKPPEASYGVLNTKFPCFPGYMRLTNQTYSTSLLMRVTTSGSDEEIDKTNTGKLFPGVTFPIMLRSEICNLTSEQALSVAFTDEKAKRQIKVYDKYPELPNDPGGYFIINGRERCIPFQQRLIFGKDILYSGKKETVISTVYKTGNTSKMIEVKKYIRTKKEAERYILNYSSVKASDNAKVPRGINLYIAFSALGYDLRNGELIKLLNSVIPDDMDNDFALTILTMMKGTILEGEAIMQRKIKGGINPLEAYLVANDQEASILSKDVERAREIAKENFLNDVFPHIPVGNRPKKAQMLAYMVIRLFQHIIYPEKYPADDKNDHSNVQFQSPSLVIEKLIQQTWSRVRKAIQEEIIKRESIQLLTPDLVTTEIIIPKINEINRIIENSFNGSLWGAPQSQAKNVVQDLNRDAFNASIIGQLTRIVIESKVRGPSKGGGKKPMESRMIQGSQLGTVCIFQTPDTADIGHTKNIAYLGKVSDEVDAYTVQLSLEEGLDEGDILPLRSADNNNMVFLNGVILGWGSSTYLFEKIRNLRRKGKLYASYDEDETPIPYFDLGLQIVNDNLYLRISSGRGLSARFVVYKKSHFIEDVEFIEQYILNMEGLTYPELLANGVIENVDPAELAETELMDSYRELLIANDKMEQLEEKYINATTEDEKKTIRVQVAEQIRESVKTHMSLSSDEIYGHMGATIPYANRILGPRIPLQCKMVEQTVTRHPTNIRKFYAPKIRTLVRGDAPLIYTSHASRLGFDEYHVGSMVSIAFLPFEENQEDSVVWNRDSLEKFFPSKVYVLYGDQESATTDLQKHLYKPISTRERYEGESEYYYDLRRKLYLILRDKTDDADLMEVINNRIAEDSGKFKITPPTDLMEALSVLWKLHKEQEIHYDKENIKDNYDHLDEDGLPQVGTTLKEGQIMMGFIKTRKRQEADEIFKMRDKIFELENDIAIYKNTIAFLSRPKKKTVTKTKTNVIEIPRLGGNKELTQAEILKREKAIAKQISTDEIRILLEKIPKEYAGGDSLVKANIILDKLKDNYREQLAKIRGVKEDISASLRVKFSQDGVVDEVVVFSDDNYKKAKVRLVQTNQADKGNKEDNRTSQKATIGAIRRKEDLPFRSNGQICDVYVNPLGMPGRMTLAWLLEMIIGKVDAMSGTRTNGDDFKNFDFEKLVERLIENNFSYRGDEEFYNGITGRKIQGRVFTGPSFRSALKHMIKDKMGFSDSGITSSKDVVSGQGLKGRGIHGNYHVGPMEIDALLGHGAAKLVQGLMTDSRGAKWVVYCLHCGLPARFSAEPVAYNCSKCKKNKFGRWYVPVAFLNLINYLACANINVRLGFDPSASERTIEAYEGSDGEDDDDEDEDEDDEDLDYGDDDGDYADDDEY